MWCDHIEVVDTDVYASIQFERDEGAATEKAPSNTGRGASNLSGVDASDYPSGLAPRCHSGVLLLSHFVLDTTKDPFYFYVNCTTGHYGEAVLFIYLSVVTFKVKSL